MVWINGFQTWASCRIIWKATRKYRGQYIDRPDPVYFYKVPGKCNTFPSLRTTGLDTEIILGMLTNSQRPFSSEAKKKLDIYFRLMTQKLFFISYLAFTGQKINLVKLIIDCFFS